MNRFTKKLEIETAEIQSTSEKINKTSDEIENNLKILIKITRGFKSSEEDIKDFNTKIKSVEITLEKMIGSIKNFEEKIDNNILDNLKESIEDTRKAILAIKKNLE